MANDTSLTFSLYGKDVSASKSLQNLGDEANKAHGAFGRIKEVAAGVGLEQGVQALASKVMDFGKESINAFQNVGKEVRLLQRYTGDSAEEMSKLRFAAEESGVSAETLAMALGKMSKAAATAAGEKKFAALGIEVKDANGHFRSSSAIFDDVVAKLGNMKNGVEKTSTILALFGRSGMELAPLLNQGAAGIAKFKEEAQKFGLVLGQDNLDAVKKNIMAQRELHAAVEGMQVQLGKYLYPAITAVTKGFSEIVPVIAQYLKPVFEEIGKIILPLTGYIKDLAQYAINLGEHFSKTGDHMSKFQEIGKTVGSIIKSLKEAFDVLIPVLKDLWEFSSKYLAPILLDVLTVAFKGISIAVGIAVDAIKILIGLFKGLITIGKDVGTAIKDVFVFIFDGIKFYIDTVISVINFAISALNKIHVKIPDWVPFVGGKEFGVNIPLIPKLAEGGIVTSPTIAMVGEAGPEAVIPLNKAGGLNNPINIYVQGSVITERDLAAKVRDELGQLLRRKGAPIAALGL